MVTQDNSAPARALIDDALQRLGTARLSLDLAKDLLQRTSGELDRAGDRIASAAVELRTLLQPKEIDLAEAELGMAWFDSLSERERGEWLKAAGTAVPAEAWQHYKRTRRLP
jgi:PBP1b-binding outer membrane lipoprotein LpoB